MKKSIRLLLCASLAISCHNEELEFQSLNLPEFAAQIETLDCKTTLDSDNYVRWSAGDQVSMFNKSTANGLYEVKPGTEGATTCTLVHVKDFSGSFIGGMETAHVVSWYPYSEKAACMPTDDGGYLISDVEIGTAQSYSRNSFSQMTFPMVAVSTDTDLAFKNVCGALVLQLTGDASITSITIQGNAGEKLSGAAEVTVSPDMLPAVTMGTDASEKVTLDCGAGVRLSTTQATEFIITLPPTRFASGFTVTLTDAAGKKHELKTEKTNTVSRTTLHIMPVMNVDGNEEEPEQPSTIMPFTPASLNDEGISYMWDESVIPEITIHMSSDEWNALLARYDEYSHNVDYFHADFTYRKGNESTFIEDGGLRLRGNTSRRRPEGNGGEMHNPTEPDWHHCHFGINFRKFHKDSEHTIKGVRKINLKWFKDDPCHVRELYCYDLYRRYGIWTSAFSTYCRLWLQIDDETPVYYGVYSMIEPIDDEFVEKRVNGMFEDDGGYLWKCVYGVGGPADLRSADDNDQRFNWDQDNGINYSYEFKGDEEDFAAAKAQLRDFILKLNGKGDDSFYKWIKDVCDVEFLLKTYAVNVAVGMWDDHWGNGNNFYLYFNSTDPLDYKVFLLPYDYDNSLGTSSIVSDSGRQDPYDWGNSGVLMERLMKFDEFRTIYRNALKELVDPANNLFHMDASVSRIKEWQSKINPYVSNDTGEDMRIYDEPAYWGNCHFYRLMDTGSNNFFRVKTETINNMK